MVGESSIPLAWKAKTLQFIPRITSHFKNLMAGKFMILVDFPCGGPVRLFIWGGISYNVQGGFQSFVRSLNRSSVLSGPSGLRGVAFFIAVGIQQGDRP